MSVVQFPDTIKIPDLQVWNNAAFDTKEAEEGLELNFSKENQSPTLCKSPVCAKSPVPVKPLHPNGATGKSHGKPLKLLFKQGLLAPSITVSGSADETARDEKKIDFEIEEIEKEISRLSSKLQSLRLEKADCVSEQEERAKGTTATPAKHLEQKESSKDLAVPRKNNGVPGVNAKRRGVSLGPSEILVGFRSQKKGNQEMTPIQSIQSRRKSCLFKLEETEEKGRRRRSLSLSPKSRPTLPKIQATQKGFTTIGSKKHEKKDDRRLSSIQPKKLFNEGDQSASVKKPIKSGRIVASRYNQIPAQSARNSAQNDRRKTLLPETIRNESKKSEKIRSSSVGKSRVFLQDFSRINVNQMKKKLEKPSEIMNQESLVKNLSPPSISKVVDLLPKIRTFRSANDSPRDSGPAKRVADLVGRKPYFGVAESEEEDDSSVRQALRFDDD